MRKLRVIGVVLLGLGILGAHVASNTALYVSMMSMHGEFQDEDGTSEFGSTEPYSETWHDENGGWNHVDGYMYVPPAWVIWHRWVGGLIILIGTVFLAVASGRERPVSEPTQGPPNNCSRP